MTYSTLLRSGFPSPLTLAVLLTSASGLFAQAPLTIDNVTDRSVYSLSTWFRVPTTSGYVYQVLLDGKPVPTDLTNRVDFVDYHEVFVARTNSTTGEVTNRLVRFIVQSERGDPERGLIRWTPYPQVNATAAEFAGARLHVVVPLNYPPNLPFPVAAWIDDAQGRTRRANGVITATGFESQPVQIRRGHGSRLLTPFPASGDVNFDFQLHGLSDPKGVSIEGDTTWTSASGVLAVSTTWPDHSRIFIDGNLTVPAGLTLTIGAGTVIKLNPLVNITNSGRIVINGTLSVPVVLTATNIVLPERPAGAWGGFIMRGSSAELVANGTFMLGGGGATSFSVSPGSSHRSEQPVLLLQSGARAYLTNTYVLNTHGQLGNGYNSDLTLDHCLVQRAITCGEYVGGTITVNHSALIEFPEDNGVVNATIADADYDGIYFTTGTHILMNSLFGFAKDDAIDSGSGGAGTVLVTNCWVESALHEAHAWSGGGRQTWTYDTVLMNSGQGIEAGWTEGSTDASPNCFAERLLTTGNSVGARFGDNYDWTYLGRLRLTNSLILYNYRDIFLKTWNSPGSGWQTNAWVDRLGQVSFRSNFVSTPWTSQPGNVLWDPARDGTRLAHWMTTPPDAAVGIGFAVWTNQFPMTNLFSGVPVRLSSFTTNFVTVNYAFLSDASEMLASGVLTFAPGETLKNIYPAGFEIPSFSGVRAVLSSPVRGEVTGVSEVTFTELSESLPPVRASLAVLTNQFPGLRIVEGVLLQLNRPSSQPVSVNYTYDSGGVSLSSGTLVIPPGDTSEQILPGPEVLGYDLVTLTVGNPVNAALVGITSIAYSNAPLTLALGFSSGQQPLSTFNSGVPVILNAPAPAGVSVDFSIEGSGVVLTNGTLAFAQGDSSKRILTPTVNGDAFDLLQVTLSNPVRATFSGLTSAYYVRTVAIPPPTNALLIARGASTIWRYRDLPSDPGNSWRSNSFNDASWESGGAQLGFGESDQTTTITDNNQITSYFRHTFNVADPAAFTNLYLWMLRDDGGVVYLNGRELFRSPNVPAGTISYSTQTISGQNGDNTIDTATVPNYLQAGVNLIAVEMHQAAPDSSDVSFDLELTGYGGPPPPSSQPIYWGQFGGQDILAWGDSRLNLQLSDKVTGPWTNVVGAASPFTVTPGPGNSFYRLKQ